MSDTGVAQLTDVSMTQIDEQRAGRGLPGKDTGLRWNAPETFQGSPLTLSSDVFSFALLCVEVILPSLPVSYLVLIILEIFTGEVPFPKLTSLIAAMRMLKGGQPEQPPTMPTDLWLLLTQCWDLTPKQRPSMSYVADTLSNIRIHSNNVHRLAKA